MTHRRRSLAQGLLSMTVGVALLSPAALAAQTKSTTQPFNARAMLSLTSATPWNGCEGGIGLHGFALDVRYGAIDGMWWNSVCLGPEGAYGQWYINYVNGQFANGLMGTWRADRAGTDPMGFTYSGTYDVVYGYGPLSGTTGSGVFTLLLGTQQWAALDGELVFPSKHTLS